MRGKLAVPIPASQIESSDGMVSPCGQLTHLSGEFGRAHSETRKPRGAAGTNAVVHEYRHIRRPSPGVAANATFWSKPAELRAIHF
jgi:hypothetical protein